MFVPGLKFEFRTALLFVGVVSIIIYLIEFEGKRVEKVKQMVKKARLIDRGELEATTAICISNSEIFHNKLKEFKISLFSDEVGEEILFLTDDIRLYNTIARNKGKMVKILHYENYIVDVDFLK